MLCGMTLCLGNKGVLQMNLQRDDRNDFPQPDPQTPCKTQPYSGVLVLLEITVATAIVVGFFDAACQPFGWSGTLQFLLCAFLGGLLWFVDNKLNRR
jgi:hypothetical protein